jgi:tetratricopeptide (TPR) repeat protein
LDRAKRHAEELGDLNLLSDLEQMSAWICYALGEQERALEYGRTGLALAERVGNSKLIAQLKSCLGQSHAAAGEPAQAIELLAQSMELKRQGARGRTGSVPVGFAFASGSLATVHADRGEIAQSRIEMARALDAVRGTGNPIEASMLALAAMVELWRGEWSECIATCARATMTAERIQGPYVFTISQAMSSFCRFMLQRHQEDRDRLCKAADWLEARGMGLYLSMVYGCAARANWLAEDAERARDYAGRALARAEYKDPFGEAIAYRVLAGLCAREHGSPNAETWTLMDRATAAAQRRGSRPELAFNEWWRARLWQQTGDSAAARAAFESALAQFETLGLAAYADLVNGEMRDEPI